MGFTEIIGSFKGGATSLLQYSWVLWVFVPIAVLIFAGFMVKTWREQKKQWTHILRIRRVMNNGYLMPGEDKIKMMRFPLVRTSQVFRLEKPLLGCYLMPELDAYTAKNEYSIIIDTNNRIYTNKGEYFNKDKESVDVSAKHSEIDNLIGEFKQKYQKIHEEQKRIDIAQIAKFAMIGLLIIAVMIVSIKGIDKWADSREAAADAAAAEAQTWRTIQEVMLSLESNTNANLLLADKFKDIYGTKNLQNIILEARNETQS